MKKIGPYEIGTIDARVLYEQKNSQEGIEPMARKGPLRRIVRHIGAWDSENGLPCEELECGHIQMVVQDMYGPTNAYQRRCRACYKARPSDSDGGEITAPKRTLNP
jgi:hypothetical protein